MNEKIKSVFEKIGFYISLFAAFIVTMYLGKKLHGNGKQTERDSGTNEDFTDFDRETENAVSDAGNAAQSILSIIEQIKAGSGDTEG